VWWAEWAQEQVGGVHGGSKARADARHIDRQAVGRELGWVFFGIGHKGPPGQTVGAIASAYAPAAAVARIATAPDRGSYEVKSRQAGLLKGPHENREIDAAAGGIVRYAYVTPAFIMSTIEVAPVSSLRWMGFSQQSRWSGVTLPGPRARYVFPHPLFRSTGARPYNDMWGVQHLGTQIVQKLAAPLSRNAGQMAVWISPGLHPIRDGDWVFIDAHPAYLAFRPAFGGIAEAGAEAEHVIMRDDTAPIIFQAAEAKDFASFDAFKTAILGCELAVDSSSVRFRGLGDAGLIEFFYRSERMPTINGKPLDLAPPFAFDSPFLHGKWGEGLVTIGKGDSAVTRDFR
jgi:hypothetical protein